MLLKKDFNTILNEVLTEYKTAFNNEINDGTILNLKAACMASMLWGLNCALDRVARQAFVSTADSEYKRLHAAEYGIVTHGKTDEEIEALVLEAKRNKFAGGNHYDYVQWALDTSHGEEKIIYARVEPLACGEGTFDIVVMGNLRSGWVHGDLRQEIIDKIQALRPIGSGFSWGVRVCPSIPLSVDITYKASFDDDVSQNDAEQAVRAYLEGFIPGEILYPDEIIRVLHAAGARNVEILAPSAPFEPYINRPNGTYSACRAGFFRKVE